MRVFSITEVNTQLQQSPHIMKRAGSSSTGKHAPGTTFHECLSKCLQQASANAAIRSAETHVAGTLCGYIQSLRDIPRPELKRKVSAS